MSPEDGPVAQRIRHLTTNQGIPGSNPGWVKFFFSSLSIFTLPRSKLKLGNQLDPCDGSKLKL